MFYLLFAAFFIIYLIVGYLTELELSSFAVVLSITLVLTNLYMFFKNRKEEKK
ncbi:hypothetical protein MUO14_05705 [Halobacillus shinanisalinarum]|uniref:Uncharacterized protein n=1 Tax=Halobacillus shinanisalinarum TaxID=2932258 RepID=A0ABY4H279_9BACI|nr:hypothetical protein [Halobacillus shinanisalinarum]UOQ94449.1 hypothetical protein MUO14_05705 [Halobacillus shinanisalinarum]